MKRKCVDCGFLAARNWDTENLEEVKTIYREQGVAPMRFPRIVERYIVPGKDIFTQDEPICFMGECDIRGEIGELKAKAIADIKSKYPDMRVGGFPQVIIGVINKERNCKQWVKWQPESSPKEHREMIDRERQRKIDFQWHILELIVIVVGAGLFTILGAYIAKGT